MKVLLIEPPTNCFTGLIKRGYPIGLCMLASIAKQQKIAEVKVYDSDRSFSSFGDLNFLDQRQNMAHFLEEVNNVKHQV